MNRDATALLLAGAHFHGLLTNPNWIIRRVTSFEYLELPSVVLRSSLTVDGTKLTAKPSDLEGISYVDIPLGLFPKSLFGSFSITDAGGRALPLLGSNHDSQVAVGVMLHELVQQGVEVARLSESVVEKLYRIASKQDGDHIEQDLDLIIDTNESPDTERNRQIFGNDLFEIISDLDDDPRDEFLEQLWAFGVQFIPIVRISAADISPAMVIKYSEVTHSPELGLWNTKKSYIYDPRGALIDVESVNLGLPGSQHFRVLAPEGTVITDVRMIDPQTGNESTNEHVVHTTPRWTSLYTNFKDDEGGQNVRVTLIPDVRGMILPAVLALILSLLIIGTGVFLQIIDMTNNGREIAPRLEKVASQSSGAIIALFILLPSLFMLSMIRRGEHGVASSLLRQPRYAILVASAASIAACIPATFSVSDEFVMIIWGIAFLVSLVALGLILRHWWKIEQLEKEASSRWNHDELRGGPSAA